MTFRHRRALDEAERVALLRALIRPDGSRWDLIVACVLPEATEMMFVVREKAAGGAYELSKILEKEKSRVGKQIQKKTNEKYSPFYAESYDRIIRDQQEFDDRMLTILKSPVEAELVEQASDYQALYVCETVDPPMPTSGKSA